MSPERKPIGKGLRFKIFHRDAFTCQYCGRQPPDVVLELDHIRPVAEGGTNDELNLVSSCEACNRGKGKHLLERTQRPDADLAWMEAQQELAELTRYQSAKAKRDTILREIIHGLQADWMQLTGLKWSPSEKELATFLATYGPEDVEEALKNVAIKVEGGYISRGGDGWLRYMWAILRNKTGEHHGA